MSGESVVTTTPSSGVGEASSPGSGAAVDTPAAPPVTDAVEVGAMDLWMDQDVSLASLEAQVAPGQLTRAEPDEENHVVETEELTLASNAR